MYDYSTPHCHNCHTSYTDDRNSRYCPHCRDQFPKTFLCLRCRTPIVVDRNAHRFCYDCHWKNLRSEHLVARGAKRRKSGGHGYSGDDNWHVIS